MREPSLMCRSTIFKEAPAGGAYGGANGGASTSLASADELAHANNYSRPNGQNVSLRPSPFAFSL